MSEQDTAPRPSYKPLSSIAESQAAIDEVIAAAGHTLRLFDVSLWGRGFNAPARTERVRGIGLIEATGIYLQFALPPFENESPAESPPADLRAAAGA